MKQIQTDDLDAGCLTSPYPGQPCRRRVWYLEELLKDVMAESVSLWWRELPPGLKACCSLVDRAIYLSPDLYTRDGPRIRRALTHELTHIRTGQSCEHEIRAWQMQRYADMLTPPEIVDPLPPIQHRNRGVG